MKQPFRAIIPLLFSVALLLSLTTTASAAFSDFTDVKGHWAEGTLHQAYDDGILKGYDAKTMAPNRSVTMVQVVTILCRVLHVTGLGDISQFEIPQDAWYAQDVAKGVYAGLLEEQDAQVLNDPIPRGQAFILFGQAFQVVGAQPDLSVPVPRYCVSDRRTGPCRSGFGGSGNRLRQWGGASVGPPSDSGGVCHDSVSFGRSIYPSGRV